MKSHYSRFLSALVLALIFAGSLVAAPAPSNEGVPLNIGVRAAVDQKWKGMRKLTKTAHGKIYALISVKEVPSALRMVLSLDEFALVGQLRREMSAQGFREMTADEKPEILLTVT